MRNLASARGAVGIPREQQVAVVVEVADDRHVHADPVEPLDDVGHRTRRVLVVDRHPHQLAAGARQLRHLSHRARHVGGVGVGHRLHDDGMARPDGNGADTDGGRGAARGEWHGWNVRREAGDVQGAERAP